MRIRLFQGHATLRRVAGIELEAFGVHYLKCRTITWIPITVAQASSGKSFRLMCLELHPAQLRTPQRRAVSDTSADPTYNVLSAKGPGLSRHFTTPAKHDHGRDALNAEAGPERLLLLRIHLSQAD